MIKIAICDDEPMMAQELASHLAEYMKEKSITAYDLSSFPDSCALLDAADRFDVIFLDIQMEQPDGMETARLLRRRGDYSLLVFVTVLKELVFDAFQVEAYDYLLKPLDSTRFKQTMNRVLRSLEQRTAEDIVIQRGTGCEVVLLSDIVYWFSMLTDSPTRSSSWESLSYRAVSLSFSACFFMVCNLLSLRVRASL